MLYFVPFILKHIWIGSEMNVFCTNLNFLTFKVAKEEDVRDHFQVIILPSYLCEPLCKWLNSCANTENIFTVLGMLTCGLLLKENKGYDGIMQHDRKQSFVEFTLKGLYEHPQSAMFCVTENFVLQLSTIILFWFMLHTPVWSLFGSGLIKAFPLH